VGVDTAGRIEAHHLGQERGIIGDQAFRHAPCAQNLLPVIDIVQERIDRTNALLDPLGELAPFVARQHARHDIERDQPLIRRLFAIDVERDADLAEEILCLFGLSQNPVVRLGIEPFAKCPVGVAGLARLAPIMSKHFVEAQLSSWPSCSAVPASLLAVCRR